MLAKILESTEGSDGEDLHARTLFDLSSITDREANLLLDFLFYYWSTLQVGSDGAPMASDFQPEPIIPVGSRVFTARIDTTEKDPRNFMIHKLVPGASPGVDHQYVSTSFSDLPNNFLINTLLVEYVRCKQWRNPLYHEINQTIGGVKRRYTRLLLPLADENGKIIQVFYGYRQIVGPARFDLPS